MFNRTRPRSRGVNSAARARLEVLIAMVLCIAVMLPGAHDGDAQPALRGDGRLVTGVVIAVKPDQVTLYRARFDADSPGGTERVTVSLTSSTRVFVESTPGTLRDIRLNEMAVVRFVERGGERVAEEVRITARQAGNRPRGGFPGEERIPSGSAQGPSVPAPRRGQVVTGDIKETTLDRLVVVTDRDVSTRLRQGTELSFVLNPTTLLLHNEKPADPLEIQPGGKATVRYVEESGRLIATEVRLLAGSGAYARLGASEGRHAVARPGGFDFYALRVHAVKRPDSPPFGRVPSGETFYVAFYVSVNDAPAATASYRFETGPLGRGAWLAGTETDVLTAGTTGRITKWVTVRFFDRPDDRDTPMEMTGTVTLNGVTQRRTLRYRLMPKGPGAGPQPGPPAAGEVDLYDLRVQSSDTVGAPALARVRSGERYVVMLYVRLRDVPPGARITWSYTTGSPGGPPGKPVTGAHTVPAGDWSDRVEYVGRQHSNLSGNRAMEQEITATVTLNGVTKSRTTRFIVVPAGRAP